MITQIELDSPRRGQVHAKQLDDMSVKSNEDPTVFQWHGGEQGLQFQRGTRNFDRQKSLCGGLFPLHRKMIALLR